MNNKIHYIATGKSIPLPDDIYSLQQLLSMDQYFAAKNIDKVNKSLKFYSDNNLLGDYQYKPKKDVHIYPKGGLPLTPNPRFMFNSSL